MTEVPDDVLEALIRVYGGALSFADYISEDGEVVITDEDNTLIDKYIAGDLPSVLTSAGIPVTADSCPAVLYHGPGHQSRARCEVQGLHTEHVAHYDGGQRAEWRDGQYLDQLRKREGHTIPEWVTPGTAMTGFFNEPPTVD